VAAAAAAAQPTATVSNAAVQGPSPRLATLPASAAAPGVQLHVAVMADAPCWTTMEHVSQVALQQKVKPLTLATLPCLPVQAGPTSQPWLWSTGCPLGGEGGAATSACAAAAAGSQTAATPEQELPGPQCESGPEHWELAPHEEATPEHELFWPQCEASPVQRECGPHDEVTPEQRE